MAYTAPTSEAICVWYTPTMESIFEAQSKQSLEQSAKLLQMFPIEDITPWIQHMVAVVLMNEKQTYATCLQMGEMGLCVLSQSGLGATSLLTVGWSPATCAESGHTEFYLRLDLPDSLSLEYETAFRGAFETICGCLGLNFESADCELNQPVFLPFCEKEDFFRRIESMNLD